MTKEQAKQLIAFEQKFKEADPLYTIDKEFSITPFNYGTEIEDFIRFCYHNNLVPPNYLIIEEELLSNRNKAKWFAELSEEKVIQSIAYFICGDRFSDGLLASKIEDGTILFLLERIKVLHGL